MTAAKNSAATTNAAAATADSVEIRPCVGLDEMERCVQLQVAVWGHSDGDVVPRKLFLLAQKIGGQVFGAFESASFLERRLPERTGNLVAFAMSLPGYRDGHAYLHSHMLAVLPEYRNLGLGLRLKLAQKDDALARGISLIEWTFDPLQIKNAYLNIEKLGAVARRYTPDFYGPSTSPLQGGLPTDRLHAEWWLQSSRVERALSGRGIPAAPTTTIPVSQQIDLWKRTAKQRPLALQAQAELRASFLSSFAQGLCVLRFQRDAEGNGLYRLGAPGLDT